MINTNDSLRLPDERVRLYGLRRWSGIRESNPPLWLGKPVYYHCTNPARRPPGLRLFVVAVAVVAAFSVLTEPAHGQADARQEVYLGPEAVAQGFTLNAESRDFAFGIFPGVFTRPLTLVIQPGRIDSVPLPDGLMAVSDFWVFDIQQAEREAITKPIYLRIAYNSQTNKKRAVYIGTGAGWKKLPSWDSPDSQRIRAKLFSPSGQVVVAEDDRSQEGLASWYRSSAYPYGAANNEFPLGSHLRVTNLETGATVNVEVVSRGPYVNSRVIDLSLTAFTKVASPSAGLARVRVEPLAKDAELGTVDAIPPAVSARTALVYNPETDAVVWEKKGGVERSIASLTKLMTALVFLEHRPSFQTVVTMQTEDTPQPDPGVRLAVSPGERVTVRDLLYATLTGSANNAALALARSTGLTRDQFVATMNEKAAGLGLVNTRFVDPTGLDVGNVSTARDLAKLVDVAMDERIIRNATTRRAVSYTKLDTREVRTIKNPLYLYNRVLDDEPIYGAKTGFLNEAGRCVALEAVGDGGKTFIVIVLFSPSNTTRSQDAQTLIQWGRHLF